MGRRSWCLAVAGIWIAVFVAVSASNGPARAADQSRGGGWTLPPNAADEKNPLTVNDAVLAAGKKIFASKCQRCHGAEGKGDGPDADKQHADDMNLTNPARAERNPDGVVFYKVWNGRKSPKMPVFSEELSKEQVWAVVAYVQTLRAK